LSSRSRPYSSQNTAFGRSSYLGGTTGGWSTGATGFIIVCGFGFETKLIAEGLADKAVALNLLNSSLGRFIILGSLNTLIFFFYYL
jgi:hypothetical protein